jgi:mannitol-specific phosphotransferase system IIBC component
MTDDDGTPVMSMRPILNAGLGLIAILGSVFAAYVVTAPEAHPVARIAFALVVGVIVSSTLLHDHDGESGPNPRIVVMAREDVSEFVGKRDDGG